ncbi:MAG: peptidoglycan recognition family protein [bacterium]
MRGQTSDEEKKRLFLQAREQIEPVSKPTPSPTPRPKPKPAASPKSSAKSKSKTPETPRKSPPKSETSTAKKSSDDEESAVDEEPSKKKPAPREESHKPESDDYILIPGEKPDGSHPSPTATPVVKETKTEAVAPIQPQIPKGKTPSGRPLDAPIQIEKSGLQEDAGLEPPPKLPFGGFMKRYRYLTPAVRKAIDGAKVQRGRWKYIVVHNSGTRQGNARIFDLYHRNVRKMPNGLAYHFVIGNGNSSGDGQIEIGNRWTRQINGGHVASDYLNDISLGICLVGDLNRDLPTRDQLGALDELCTYLRDRVGKIKGRSAIVKGHKEINPKPTDCPGDRFPLGWLRKRFGG